MIRETCEFVNCRLLEGSIWNHSRYSIARRGGITEKLCRSMEV